MHVVVVGAGVMGLMCAVESVLAGHEVTVLDGGPIPHPSSSSSDHHRVLRAVHTGDRDTSRAAREARGRWLTLQDELGTRLLHERGALSVLSSAALRDARAVAADLGVAAVGLSPAETAGLVPHLSLPAGRPGLFEPDGGVLLAERVLESVTAWLRDRPEVVLRPRLTATAVDPDRGRVVAGAGEVVGGDAVVVAAGAWTASLLPQVRATTRVHRQSVVYCDVPAAEASAWEATPAIPALGTPEGAWLVPPVAGTPMKFSSHSTARVVRQVGGRTTAPERLGHLVEQLRTVVPAFDESWIRRAGDCYYTTTGAGGSRVDHLGPRCVAVSACGGTSFKTAPVVARALVRHVTAPRRAPDRPTSRAIQHSRPNGART